MNLLEADIRLRKLFHPCVATRDVAAYLDISIVNASNFLRRLEAAHRITRLSRGRWLVGERADPFMIPECLTAPFPAYISLQSALYHHGMISQIPSVVYAISLARSKRYKNPIGEFSVHHVAPQFFFGFELIKSSVIKIATPEKALIDFLYLAPGRSRMFRAFPELELPRAFSEKKAYAIIERIPSRSRRSGVRSHFKEILERIPPN